MMLTTNNIPKILVVDDGKIWFKLLEIFTDVANVKLDMTYALNGQEAVDIVESGEKFDAILMNIEMPLLDGLGATQLIRKKDQVTPIIAWTCHDEDYIGERCRDVGMNDFIEKDGGNLVKDIVDSLRKVGVKV